MPSTKEVSRHTSAFFAFYAVKSKIIHRLYR